MDAVDFEFETKKVKELKVYLRSHGQNISGNKKELVRRSKGTQRLAAQRAVDGDRDTQEPRRTETGKDQDEDDSIIESICLLWLD